MRIAAYAAPKPAALRESRASRAFAAITATVNERQRALDGIIRVETRRIQRVSKPGPPDQKEQKRVARERRKRIVCVQWTADLCNCRHKTEIEEEFEPGCAPSGCVVGGPCCWKGKEFPGSHDISRKLASD